MAVYAAMIDRMDRGIGLVLEAIRKAGQEDNTLVMFLSDNGACTEPYMRNPGGAPNHAAQLLPWANASNTPFRLFKRWEHEGNRAMRDGRWKLVVYYNEIHEQMNKVGTGRRTGAWELFDLETDRTELKNLAGKEPRRLRSMVQQYGAWEKRVGVTDWEVILKAGGFYQDGP